MKYEIRKDEAREINGHKVFRIYAKENFETFGGLNISAGDKGGWVQGKRNLAQEGRCWIADDAAVYGNARVYDDAIVAGNARVADDAQVYDAAWVYGNAAVSGASHVREGARVYGNAVVSGESWLTNNALVCDNAQVKNVRLGRDVVITGRVCATCSEGDCGWIFASGKRDDSWLISRMRKAANADDKTNS